MSGVRLIGSRDVAFVAGGAPELRALFRAGALDIGSAKALVVREPRLPGAPFYVVIDDDARQKILARLRAAPETLPPGWVGQVLDAQPAPLAGRHDRIQGGVVLEGDDFVGVWAQTPARLADRSRIARAVVGVVQVIGLSNAVLRRRQRSTVLNGGAAEGELAGIVGDGGNGGNGARGDPLIRRTPHLDAPDKLPMTPGRTFKIKVWTDQAPARLGEESEDVVVEAPADIQKIELGVLLVTSPHLWVRDPYFKPLIIDRDVADSNPVEFTVTVAENDAIGPVTLIAKFLYRGRPCGRVKREWTWPDGRAIAPMVSTAGVPVHTSVQAPDLSVVITATGAGRFTCSVGRTSDTESEIEWTRPVEWAGLPQGASAFIAAQLEPLLDRSKPPELRRRALQTAGREFWKAAPKPFQEALWDLIDRRAAKNAQGRAAVYIASEEPLLPWEIMRPTRQRAGLPDEDRPQPIGIEFAVGRWVRGDATSPPQTLPIRDSLLIAARYPQREQSLDPTNERLALEQHFGGRKLNKATYDYLETYLRENAASLLHFVCHGQSTGNDTTIFLDDWEECTSMQLRDNQGVQTACAKRLPVVFLNACYAGRGNLTLGPGGAGFPQAFCEMGARAIIAPLWPVTKVSAPLVAKEIYDTAAADPQRPLADILAELRARSYDKHQSFDDSWAAYCLFGDPRGKLQRQ